jgi:hypothetical protein
MPLTQNFTATQIIGSPGTIIFTDTSTGSDVLVTGRRILLAKYDGTYLVPSGTLTNYIDWPLIDNPLIVSNVLNKDYSLLVTISWIDIANVALYSKSTLYVFPRYNTEFDYSLTYDEANGLSSINTTNWVYNRMKLRVAINDSINAISEASSITDSQAACDRGTYLRENQNLFY